MAVPAMSSGLAQRPASYRNPIRVSGGGRRAASGVLRESQLCHFLFPASDAGRNENEKAAILAALQDRRRLLPLSPPARTQPDTLCGFVYQSLTSEFAT